MHRHVDFSGNPAISKVVASLKIYNADGYKEVVPFIDEKGDVSPFQEVRTTSTVDIGQAVWILTTKRIGNPPRLYIPAIDTFEKEYGRSQNPFGIGHTNWESFRSGSSQS